MSSLRIEKLKAEHIAELFKEEAAKKFAAHITPWHAKGLEESNLCYTAFMDDKIVACGGAVEYWKNRGEAWIIFGKTFTGNFILLQRAAREFIHRCPLKRLEASVVLGFDKGHRWIKSLGFKLETPLAKSYTQDGEDCALYSRVRGD